MGCQGIPLATKGMIYPVQTVSPSCTKYVLPFNLQLTNDAIKVNLNYLPSIKLNSFLDKKALNLLKLSNFKLNQKLVKNLKLNLKKCEE